jgi:hypothetical protein
LPTAWRKLKHVKEVDGIDAMYTWSECSIKDCVILFRTLSIYRIALEKRKIVCRILKYTATKLLKT